MIDLIGNYLISVSCAIHEEEMKIDSDAPIYLITYSPDPSQLPDSDCTYQHLFHVNILIDYLKCCSCGVFVHEFTQMGNPHYHGWYQVDNAKSMLRASFVKCMQKFGNLKITPVKSVYKINDYARHRNALGYYKKETFDKYIEKNPILSYTPYDDTNWQQKLFMMLSTVVGRKSINDLLDIVSNKKYYTEFYKKSD